MLKLLQTCIFEITKIKFVPIFRNLIRPKANSDKNFGKKESFHKKNTYLLF